MAGTKEGGRLAAATNKRVYGQDFYRRVGAKGGKLGRTGGFYANRALASHYGALGGTISRRGTPLSQSERAKKRQEFIRTYDHLQAIADKAEKARQSEYTAG